MNKDNYHYLTYGEIIQEGDEFASFMNKDNNIIGWLTFSPAFIGCVYNGATNGARRKLKEASKDELIILIKALEL